MASAIRSLLSSFALAALVACGASSGEGADGGPGNADGGLQNTADARPPLENAEVYAHSATTLYKLNPNTLAVTTVANFSGCSGSVIDIALDKDSKLYGTTFEALYSIDRQTGVCTEVSRGTYPNSLSFVPAGILHPTEEVLVAYLDSQYIRIDVTSGEIFNIGDIGGGFRSSGDVVSVEGGGTYLTAEGPNCDDCLVQINPADGSLQRNWGPLGFTAVYGLAFWGGTAYGFDDNGTAFSIEFGADTVTTTPIDFPDSPAGLSFYGAGSTTQAPIID